MSTDAALLDTLRAKLNGADDDYIKLEIYNTVFELARDALRIDPPTDPDADLDTWLTADQWTSAYQAVVEGTLARMYAQVGKPWANGELAKYHLDRYASEKSMVRSDNAAGATTEVFARLMQELRIKLPSALDDVIKMELFGATEEFLRWTNVWKEDVTFTVTDTEDREYWAYPPLNAEAVRLMKLVNSDDIPAKATMPEPSKLVFASDPTAGGYVATLALTVSDPTTDDGFPDVPDWIVRKHRDALIHGVLGRMMAQQGKPYSNAALALFHMKKFVRAKAQAKTEANIEHVHGGQRWRFPQAFVAAGR